MTDPDATILVFAFEPPVEGIHIPHPSIERPCLLKSLYQTPDGFWLAITVDGEPDLVRMNEVAIIPKTKKGPL